MKNKKESYFKKLEDALQRDKFNLSGYLLFSKKENSTLYSSEINSASSFLRNAFSEYHLNSRSNYLDCFLFLEFILSRMLFIYMTDKKIDFSDNKFIDGWNKMLSKITFREKLMLLKKFEIIDKNLKKKLDKICDIRNDFAHKLRFDDSIPYQLAEYFVKVEKELIDTYINMWDTEEMAKYILDNQKNKSNHTKQ